jgi:alpha-tubulin suppressor-like RCC1 family protein
VLTSGKVQCWGANYTGQVGAGSGNIGRDYDTPTYVVNVSNAHITGISSINAGGYHTCGVTTGAKLYCWGSNSYGQLGLDNADEGQNFGYARFVKASSGGVDITAIAQVSLGDIHSCAKKTDGTLWCWGSDFEGQVGNDASFGSTVVSPTVVSGFSAAGNTQHVSAGKQHTCAVRPNGSVLCWGANTDYQLGDGTTNLRRTTPVAVVSLGIGAQNKVVEVSAGSYSSCARDSVNNLRCWGDDSFGQVGVWGPRAVMQY